MNKLARSFLNPSSPRQRQYEALRAIAVDKLPIKTAAKKFGYSILALRSLMRDANAGKLELFPIVSRGPQERRTPTTIRDLVSTYRKENLSAKDIAMRLKNENDHELSVRTVERILADAGFPKLQRRTHQELGKTKKNQIISQRSEPLDFEKLRPFRYDCPVAGVFFFLPYLIESGLLPILKQCSLPKSSAISAEQACLSMLLLKIMGSERLSHSNAYDHEPGFGIFAGLNLLPKATYMATYSCRTSEKIMMEFQQQIMILFQKKYPDFYQSNFINLDFHSIPHFGEQSQMEKVWCGARGKGANTIFAQDNQSNAILYTRADILHKDEAKEIQNFVTYWKAVRKTKTIQETLVFDCKLTTYPILDELSNDGIHFITLRKRNKKLLAATDNIPKDEWQKVYLPIPKRKYKSCSVYVSEICLPKCNSLVKQIIVTDHGRAQPTYIITNNRDLDLDEIIKIYAKRWRLENKFSELVAFFNLNALSSPLMIRIHFDILWTVIADTLYRRFAQDLPRFERERADTLFRRFINMPGQVVYNKKEFIIKIRKRAHTPILMGVEKLQQDIKIPWLNNIPMRIEWTA
jgi:transposase